MTKDGNRACGTDDDFGGGSNGASSTSYPEAQDTNTPATDAPGPNTGHTAKPTTPATATPVTHKTCAEIHVINVRYCSSQSPTLAKYCVLQVPKIDQRCAVAARE